MRKESGAAQREMRKPRFYCEKANDVIRVNDNKEACIEQQEIVLWFVWVNVTRLLTQYAYHFKDKTERGAENITTEDGIYSFPTLGCGAEYEECEGLEPRKGSPKDEELDYWRFKELDEIRILMLLNTSP
ncbi:uncharacterized protein E5676_scaffold772G00040 [Cucumis melo var. makuwa]|uniref:Uncharacterized protein n=1 Tax=Cucumis melo var. makuwa TaxID=1194695 RepID=A0A5D3BNQ9_CUCMM|nr:uncharacterized protein E5676_scaffold772G00040 [Cucumis melo var. makuwa]